MKPDTDHRHCGNVTTTEPTADNPSGTTRVASVDKVENGHVMNFVHLCFLCSYREDDDALI